MRNPSKKDFCQSFDWQVDIRWLDLSGVHRLDTDRIAIIKLSTYGTSVNYQGFLVRVLNKREGEIDRKYFAFDDYLDLSEEGRVDTRTDLRAPSYEVVASCVASCGWDWYIAVPKSTRPLTEAVESYLELFR